MPTWAEVPWWALALESGGYTALTAADASSARAPPATNHRAARPKIAPKGLFTFGVVNKSAPIASD
jgi:hypothetical protein